MARARPLDHTEGRVSDSEPSPTRAPTPKPRPRRPKPRSRGTALQQVIDLVPMIVFAKDWDGNFLLANQALATAYGTTVAEILRTWHGDLDVPPGQLSRMIDEDRAVMSGGVKREIPRRVLRDASGRERILHVTKVPFTHDGVLAVLGVARDITESVLAEERFTLAIEAAPAGMMITDAKGTIELVNREVERMFGYGRRELLGKPSSLLVPERLRDRHLKLRQTFLDGRRRHEAVRGRDLHGRRKDGSEFPVELSMNTVRTPRGQRILSAISDVTERLRHRDEIHRLNQDMEQRVIDRTRELARANERLRAEVAERQRAQEELMATKRSLEQANALLAEQALRDALTGLPNRRAFDTHLDAEVRRSSRTGAPMALLMIDVDHFKRLNDAHGHVRGDECLAEVGRAIGRCMRRPADFGARYGGEEFAAVLGDTDRDGAATVAETVRHEVEASVRTPDGEAVTVSVGVAIGTFDNQTPEARSPNDDAIALVAAADRALYTAKQSGRNRIEVILPG